jgi:hypothetical protein
MAYIRRCYTSKGEYMNQEDIIRMVREAGWSGIYTQWREPDGSPDWTPVKESLTVPVTMEQIERFAALVAAAEREACAKVCDVLAVHPEYASDITKVAAQAIRARGEK